MALPFIERMWPRSLSGRLMLATLAGMVAAAGVVAVAMLAARPSVASMMARELAKAADRIDQGLRIDAAGNASVHLDRRKSDIYDAMRKDAAYRVVDAGGRTVASSGEGPLLDALQSMPLAVREFRMPAPDGDMAILADARPVVRDGRRYTVQVARSDRLVLTLDEYEGQLYLQAGLASAACALAVFCLVVFLTVSRMVRPLRKASLAASRIEPRNLTARLRVDGLPAEIRPLVQAFNAALERLEAGYRVQQEFLAAAAHELKTPLALLRTGLELGDAADRKMLLREADLMARHVHQLLHLAEVSEARNYRFAPVRIEDVAADAIDYMARPAGQRAVRLALQPGATAGAAVHADAGAVFVLIRNLLENAVNHSPPGSAVMLCIAPDGFSVADQGPGIPDADRSSLFERFWRGPGQPEGGTGLGLAICREIATAHGWHIRAANAAGGPGAVFEVRFAREARRA
ncbi:HAMP domain-containing sensor histidine kinase [[Pseudomonas] boreopolis]|uniref:sensor histidine kinase n=1 Tax=Xanthomonas boreopolis TaxID=86183 RepID=UPI003DA16645